MRYVYVFMQIKHYFPAYNDKHDKNWTSQYRISYTTLHGYGLYVIDHFTPAYVTIIGSRNTLHNWHETWPAERNQSEWDT